jgi:hypothetical protein
VNPRMVPIVILALLWLVVGAEALFFHHGERWPGFFALFGLASTAVLVLGAKTVVGRLLGRAEDGDDW